MKRSLLVHALLAALLTVSGPAQAVDASCRARPERTCD
jgi:hypothetical protein